MVKARALDKENYLTHWATRALGEGEGIR